MGINFDDLKNKAQNLVKDHGDKIEQGVEKAGDLAKKKFGHADKVDKVVNKVQDAIPDKPGADKPGADNPGDRPVDRPAGEQDRK